MGYNIVWFKRDLRLHDHVALDAARCHGPIFCLYIVEPSLWAQPDAAAQHYVFIRESLVALDADLRKIGGQLHVFSGEVVDVLARLHCHAPFNAIYAHEETGNGHTFKRDLAVGQWCKEKGVGWHEFAQFGVTRRLRDRNEWQRRRDAFMGAPQINVGAVQFADISPKLLNTMSSGFSINTLRSDRNNEAMAQHTCHSSSVSGQPSLMTGQSLSITDQPRTLFGLPSLEDLHLDPFIPPQRQRGGRHRGLAILRQFLNERSAWYRGGISSPLSATSACSRLSAHLAYGTLSLREVVQATHQQLDLLPPSAQRQRKGLQAFVSRLYWHCHFIQKLESQPSIEFQNLHPGYDGLREPEWNAKHFDALTQGRTGWPMVDACVAMLRETGWLNFRMRAMLVSVAAYPLWLHWREVGLWLARQFLDYEPGIHWSQLQMQSGTSGINTTRVYNPVKQALDHDPDGRFVRRWLPAMRRVPDAWLFEPWRMPESIQAQCGIKVGVDIPFPVVDLETATRTAKARVHALRRQADVRGAKAVIIEKHASRRGWSTRDGSGSARPSASARSATQRSNPKAGSGMPSPQLALDF